MRASRTERKASPLFEIALCSCVSITLPFYRKRESRLDVTGFRTAYPIAFMIASVLPYENPPNRLLAARASIRMSE
jgi:hypothetical protein